MTGPIKDPLTGNCPSCGEHVTFEKIPMGLDQSPDYMCPDCGDTIDPDDVEAE